MSDDPEAALELIKLPSDVSELDAGLMYNKGVSKLSASEALAAQRFVDARRRPQRRHVHATALRRFLFGSLDAAIDAAIAAEGFDSPYYQSLYEAGKVKALNLGVDFTAATSSPAWRRACASSRRMRGPIWSTAPRARTGPALSPPCWSADGRHL